MRALNLEDQTGAPGNPDYFVGQVTLTPVRETTTPAQLFRVEFSPGARTNWHTHSGVQVLVVLAGRCRYQQEGGKVLEASTGEVIHIPAGQKHWHGATPEAGMVHLAVNIAAETQWLEVVTDEEFGGG
jgi:quercetin dioxygenase-like cupin family protein